MTKKILIVEDDAGLGNGLEMALKEEGISFFHSASLLQARKLLKEESFSLILLDLNLPDGSGLDFLKEIRSESQIPVIILTANDMEMDIVVGLEMGADDYITKPFSLMVLRARVKAQLRRLPEREWSSKEEARQFGALFLDFPRMEFKRDGRPLELSRTEQRILYLLTSNPGIILKRERLIDYVWTQGAEFVDENALSVAVKRLRDKLGDGKDGWKYIRTVYGVGYVWKAERDGED
ncbi:MAG: response regulator transcription factor [Ruminococcus sp.]|jgi:two-component system response regulator RegX3